MASSRIYVKDLPHNITEGEFRKHLSEIGHVTDTKLLPHRRIGFVGYKTSDEAQKAVKYFNRTFIRTSRLSVELATPVPEKNARDEAVQSATGAADGDMAGRMPKRKRPDEDAENEDPKLKEFLEISRSKKRKRVEAQEASDAVETVKPVHVDAAPGILAEQRSDEEYEEVPKVAKRRKASHDESTAGEEEERELAAENVRCGVVEGNSTVVSDADWARSRTKEPVLQDGDTANRTSPAVERGDINQSTVHAEKSAIDEVRSSMRLFLRNLSYDITEADLEHAFESYGNLEEVHINLAKDTRKSKCTAFIQYSNMDSAETAMREMDGQTLHGRLLHVLPAQPRRGYLDDFALSKLPLKQQREIRKRREAASKMFNWNSLYMNPDAVVSSVAGRLGLAKSEVLDPTSSDAAVKQAQAETHIIQETRTYFEQHGVDLNSFKKKQRGDTAILVKNIPYDSREELKRRFEEHGELKKFLVPPAGTIAIVEFATEGQGQAAFAALNRRRFKSSMLYLEKAPKDLFETSPSTALGSSVDGATARTSASDLKDSTHGDSGTAGRVTLFVGNLNFSTTSKTLTERFKPLEGFLSAVVKTRTDPKRPAEVLSNGYGFLEFGSPQQAQAAIQAMNGYKIDDHKVELKISRKGADAAEDRRKSDASKKAAGTRTKISIKNLDFGVTKKDIRSLLGAYGQLRSVRVPQKMDRSARGFGFADFTTPKEAQSAMDALKDTHLLSRKLVLEFADEEPDDAEVEIEKMQRKVGAQANKVALRNLTSGGRKKFSTQIEDEAA